MPVTPEPAPQANPAALAANLRLLISVLRRRLREQADAGDVTPSQAAAWKRLESDGPMTVTALARAEGVRPQSMGVTIKALEEARLIERTPDPTDGRQSVLSVSAAAREKFEKSRAIRQDWLTRRIERELDSAEREVLAEALSLLGRIAGD